jgi:trigger factor
MAVNVETLEKLERKITLTLPVESIQSEVEARLRKLARTVRMDGFRPGKVPMSVVARQYGYSVQYEVMNDKVGEAFFQAADEAKLRVAGQPAISEKEGAPEGQMAFDAVFEVFPEVKIGDLASAEIEKPGRRRGRGRHRPHPGDPAQAAPQLCPARQGRRRRGR